MWGLEAKRAKKFAPRTMPWNFITMLSAPLRSVFFFCLGEVGQTKDFRVRGVGVPGVPGSSLLSVLQVHLGIGNGGGKQGHGNQPPIDDTDPIRKFSIDPGSHTDLQNPAEFSPKGKPIRNFSIDPTSSIRTRLRTPFLRTPFPRLLVHEFWGVPGSPFSLSSLLAQKFPKCPI